MNDESVRVSEHALMRSTLELAMLIDAVDAETLNADTAVKWLEEIGAAIQRLPEDAKRRLADVAGELAAEYRDQGWTGSADFFDDSAEAFGFALTSAPKTGASEER